MSVHKKRVPRQVSELVLLSMEPSDLIKNVLICVPKMNEGPMGLEQHEGE